MKLPVGALTGVRHSRSRVPNCWMAASVTLGVPAVSVLVSSVKAYEEIAASVSTHREEEWWHKANSLWHASRDYSRRHEDCDSHSKTFSNHSPARLAELTMAYDLEASALLALHHAVTAYRKVVPDAELDGHTARVA